MGVDQVDDVSVITVAGDLDLGSQPKFKSVLADAIGPAPAVLIDLCACTFIDSSGLSAILVAVQQAKADGIRLAVACRPDGAPRKLFDLIIGHSMFATCTDRASGIAALRGPARGEA